MTGRFSDAINAAKELRAYTQDYYNKSFKKNYCLDIIGLANGYLQTRGWNDLYLLNESEWKKLTSDEKYIMGRSAEGFIDQDAKIIFIRKSGTQEKVRSTIGHELGHYELHINRYSKYEPLPLTAEYEAEAFNRALLAPSEEVNLWIKENTSRYPHNGYFKHSAVDIACSMAHDFLISTKTAAKVFKEMNFRADEMEYVLQNKEFQIPAKRLDYTRRMSNSF